MSEGKISKIAIIVPAYNDAGCIGGMLSNISEITAFGKVGKVFVVDDGSRDATASIAENMGAHVIPLAENVGKGWAVLAGIAQCRKEGFDTVLIMDADIVEPVRLPWIEIMISALDNGRSGKKMNMAASVAYEGKEFTNNGQFLGERMIRMSALEFLFEGAEFSKSEKARAFIFACRGLAFDLAAEHMISPKTIVYPHGNMVFKKRGMRKGAFRQMRELEKSIMVLCSWQARKNMFAQQAR